MTLVSIITPSFNQAAYLEGALNSVLLQEGVQIEYIVIDGASTDGSPQIINSYGGRLAGWVSEPDRGQADAINKGFQRASGEFIAWLNSDDLYLPGAVKTAVSALQADPALGMVFGDAISIDAAGRPLNLFAFGEWGLIDLLSFRIICQPAVFMRRQVLVQAGWLDPAYHLMLDHHLWIRMARLAPIQHIPQALAAARQHPAAKNVKAAAAFSLEINSVLHWIATQPDLAEAYNQNRRRIAGGAHRLQARYLLDGDQPAEAVRCYLKALTESPVYALGHWRRMAFALVSATLALAGLHIGQASTSARRRLAGQKHKQFPSPLVHSLRQAAESGWPGLNLDGLA